MCPDKVSLFLKTKTYSAKRHTQKSQIMFLYGTCHNCGKSRANLHVCDLILLSIKREFSLYKLVIELIYSHFIQMSCFQNDSIQCQVYKMTIQTLVTKEAISSLKYTNLPLASILAYLQFGVPIPYAH